MSVEQILTQDFGTLADVIREQAKERGAKPALIDAKRTISYVELDPDMIADPATISYADAMKAYEADKARFTSPEQRHVYQLTFTDEAVSLIARKAIERKTGARGLRSIMEGILLETMYELPGLEGVEQVVIGPEAVENKARPLFIYAEREDETKTASAS